MQPVSGAGTATKASKSKRLRFCDVLARSLRPQAELRAWFDEQLGYQPVQQTRIPLNMPNVRHHEVRDHTDSVQNQLTHSNTNMNMNSCEHPSILFGGACSRWVQDGSEMGA